MLDKEKRSKMLDEMFEQDQTVDRAMNDERWCFDRLTYHPTLLDEFFERFCLDFDVRDWKSIVQYNVFFIMLEERMPNDNDHVSNIVRWMIQQWMNRLTLT